MTTLQPPNVVPIRSSAGWAAAIAWTASAGLVVGVAVGTVIWPIVVACLFGFAGAVAGAAAGNLVAPVFIRLRSPRTVTALRILARCLAISGIAGAAIGGVGGLVLGLVAHPATAPFAIVEGAILATPTAAALGVVVAAVLALRPSAR